MKKINLAITGGLGRMGQQIINSSKKDRKFKKLGKAMVRVLTDKMPPIIVDNQGHIINGHHRYDALRLLGVPTAKVAMIGGSLKEIMDLM